MKSNFRICFIFLLFLVSCAVPKEVTPSVAPTLTATAIVTSTPLPTLTPTPEPAGTIDVEVINKAGYNLDPQNPEIMPGKTRDGVNVLYKVGGDPNNEADVVARYNKEIKEMEWNWQVEGFQDHLISIARPGIVYKGEQTYDEKHIFKAIDNIHSQYSNVSPYILTFTIRLDDSNEHYARIYFARYDGKNVPGNSKEEQSGYVFIELPVDGSDLGEILRFSVDRFVSPIN